MPHDVGREMRTHILANDLVLIDLDQVEHIALSHSLSRVMSTIEPCEIERTLLADIDEAYEFVYSVYVLDAGARLAGIDWLPFEHLDDSLVTADDGAKPVLAIAYAPTGSTWCLTLDQLRFVELAIAEQAKLMSPLSQVA